MMTTPIKTAIPIPLQAVADFSEKHHIVRLWLFGSVLRDDFTAESDVDVLVEFDPDHVPGWNIVSIQSELSALLGVAVDFSMPNALSKHIKPQIMASARMIYERA